MYSNIKEPENVFIRELVGLDIKQNFKIILKNKVDKYYKQKNTLIKECFFCYKQVKLYKEKVLIKSFTTCVSFSLLSI